MRPNGNPCLRRYDAIIVGSGFGGSMAALPLVHSGLRVLMLERGPWVRRGAHNRAPGGERVAYYEERYRLRGDRHGRAGTFECVGGASVFYGAASLRFRPADFVPDPNIVGPEPARWPFGYDELAAWYAAVERLLRVTGDERADPTAPPRGRALPAPPAPPGPAAGRLARAASALGLHPFRLPVAVARDARCSACGRCDGFACAVAAKSDLATAVLPDLIRAGLVVRANAAAVRLLWARDRVVAVEVADAASGRRTAVEADVFVLAAGALATPTILLHSGLAARNPAGPVVGACLMRHANAVVAGLFEDEADSAGQFQKEVGVHDYYLGAEDAPPGRLGSIQQLDAGAAAIARFGLARFSQAPAAGLARRVGGLIVLAEDQPCPTNRVTVSARRADALGGPRGRIRHRQTPRDLHARAALADRARAILLEAGARATATVPVSGFAHALGGVRMGQDRRTAPLDPEGRFRGVANLYVTDGSAFPTSGGVNPSLTIAANALRIGAGIVGRARVGDADLEPDIPAQPTHRRPRSLHV